mgnify:CR=1 FL=1
MKRATFRKLIVVLSIVILAVYGAAWKLIDKEPLGAFIFPTNTPTVTSTPVPTLTPTPDISINPYREAALRIEEKWGDYIEVAYIGPNLGAENAYSTLVVSLILNRPLESDESFYEFDVDLSKEIHELKGEDYRNVIFLVYMPDRDSTSVLGYKLDPEINEPIMEKEPVIYQVMPGHANDKFFVWRKAQQ